jgi:hypothetical protein
LGSAVTHSRTHGCTHRDWCRVVTLAGNLQIQTRLPELLHHQMNRVSRGSRYPSAISMSAVESAQLQSEIICNQSIIIIVCVHVCSSQMRANGPPSKFEILDPRNGQFYHIISSRYQQSRSAHWLPMAMCKRQATERSRERAQRAHNMPKGRRCISDVDQPLRSSRTVL